MAVLPTAGELERRVSLQSPAQAAGALNERRPVYSEFAKVWAKFQMLRGRDLFAQAQQQVISEARCVIRYRNDVTARTRVIHDGKAWDVVGEPIVLGRKEFLELMLTSGPRQEGG